MALRDLQNELNDLIAGLAKKAGGGGGDDPFRKELNFLTHSYSYSEQDILNQLLNIKGRFDAEGNRLARDKSKNSAYQKTEETAAFGATREEGSGNIVGPDATMLKNFAKAAFKELNTQFKTRQSSSAGKTKFRLIEQGSSSTVVARARKGQKVDVYSAIQKAQSAAMKNLKDDFIQVFQKGSRTIGGTELFNVGHRTAVTQRKVDAVNTLLAKQNNVLGKASKLVSDEIKGFKITHGMDATHSTKISMKGGKLTSKLRVNADVESWFLNQKERAAKETKIGKSGGWVREDAQESQKQADTLIKRIQKIIQDEYDDPETNAERRYSDPFIQTFGEMIVNVSGVKKLAKTGVVKNRSRYKLKVPKTKAEIKAKGSWSQKGKVQKHKNPNIVSGFGAFKGASRAAATDAPNSLAPLLALLNAKLPQEVASNMGPPGLEYQTGRFASSVRVTDVNRTPQGHPSIGYTYQKDPYQVFEGGSGSPRYATNDRDPRKLIDRSIREIAAEFALGRFYTRRV